MAEEPNLESQAGTTDDPPVTKPDGPDEAEVTRLTKLAGEMEQLQATATDAGFDTVNEYLETLEATAYDKVSKSAVEPEVKPEVSPAAKPEAQPAPTVDNQRLQTMERMVASVVAMSVSMALRALETVARSTGSSSSKVST